MKRKRQNAVAINPSINGVEALSTELQTTNNTALTRPKRKPIKTKSTIIVPTPRCLEIVPVKNTCQGCVHGDLLELKVMEPVHIKYYLKNEGFLASAKCAGDCQMSIQEIFIAAPKANLCYCDENNKGFYAPDNDPLKADMECGLILCSPCHATRQEKYALEHTSKGGNNRRNNRRCGNK